MIISFKTKSGSHNYRAKGFKRNLKKKTFEVEEFIVHRTKTPTLEDNEGHGGPAMFYAPHYTSPRRLKTLTLK
jgi:hypothetical protein